MIPYLFVVEVDSKYLSTEIRLKDEGYILLAALKAI